MAKEDKTETKIVELDKAVAAMRKMIEDLPKQFAKMSTKVVDSAEDGADANEELKSKYDHFFAEQKANAEAAKRQNAILVRDRKVQEARVFMQQVKDRQSFLKMSMADKATVLSTMMTTEKQAVKTVLRSLSPIDRMATGLLLSAKRVERKVNSLSDEFKEHIGDPIKQQFGGIVETFTGPFYGILRQSSRYLSSIGAYSKAWEGMKGSFATIKGWGKPKKEGEGKKLTVEEAYDKLGILEKGKPKKVTASPVPEMNLFEGLSPDVIAAAFGKVKGFEALEKLAEIDFGKLAAPKVAVATPVGTAAPKEAGLSVSISGMQDSISAMSSGLYDVKDVLNKIYNSNIVGSLDFLTYSIDQLAAKQQPSKVDIGDYITNSVLSLDTTLRSQAGLIVSNLYDMWSALVDMNETTKNCGCIDNAVIKGITTGSQSIAELSGTYASMQDDISTVNTNIGHISEGVGRFQGIYAEYMEYQLDFRDKLFKHLEDIEHTIAVSGGGAAGNFLSEMGGEVLGDILGGGGKRGRRGRAGKRGLLGRVFGKIGGKALGGTALLGAGIGAYEGYSEGREAGLGKGAAGANAVARGTITGATTAIGGMLGGYGGAAAGAVVGNYAGDIANRIGENLGTQIFDIKESAVKSFGSLGSKIGIGMYDILNAKFDTFLGKGKTIKDYLFDIFKTFLPGMGLMSMAKGIVSLPKAEAKPPATVNAPKAAPPKPPVMKQPEMPKPSPLKGAAAPQTINVKTTSTVGWDPTANNQLNMMNKNLEELVAISRVQRGEGGGAPAGGGSAGLNIPNTAGDPRAISNGNYYGQRDKQWSR